MSLDTVGTRATIKRLTERSLSAYSILLPPIAEQRRIVAKVDQLMALEDEYETQLDASRLDFGTELDEETLNAQIRIFQQGTRRAADALASCQKATGAKDSRPNPAPMTPRQPLRHLLIDFENVPKIDLSALAGIPVEVTLLVGERNRQLGVDLVEQLLAAECNTRLIKVGASGRNALDLTLAYYLGQAAVEQPHAEFYIISRDTDFDAMIKHLKRHGVRVSRHETVETLPFLEPSRSPASAREPPAAKMPTSARIDDRFDRILKHLMASPNNRPKRRTTLLSHIKAQCGGLATAAEAEAIIARLSDTGVVAINDKGRVSYSV